VLQQGYAPPGWPEEVRPPGAPDWERTAVAYLFDCCPPDLRGYEVLRRHPPVLARFAAVFVAALGRVFVPRMSDRAGRAHGTRPADGTVRR
jgi:hypothetical protein